MTTKVLFKSRITTSRTNPIQQALRLYHPSLIHKIHKHSIRRPSVDGQALVAVSSDTPVPRHGVCSGRVDPVGNQDAEDINVEEVVDDVHASCRGGGRRPVHATIIQGGICHVEGALEEVAKFVQDVVVW